MIESEFTSQARSHLSHEILMKYKQTTYSFLVILFCVTYMESNGSSMFSSTPQMAEQMNAVTIEQNRPALTEWKGNMMGGEREALYMSNVCQSNFVQ